MTLFVMRHAPTRANAETAGPETIRGWGSIGLGPEGHQIAQTAAQQFQGKPPAVIVTSDLPRAKETAEDVGKVTGASVVPSAELRTWNVGTITGQPVETAKPELDRLQHVTPQKPAPGGESYLDFYKRWGQTVQQLRDLGRDRDVLAVVHGRQVYSLPHLLQGKPPEDIPTHGRPNPGDILRVDEATKRLVPVHQAQSAPKVTT